MIKTLVKLPSGESVLAVGLVTKNFERFNVAPDPKTVDVVVLCVSDTHEELAGVLRAHGLVPEGATLDVVPRQEPVAPAAAPSVVDVATRLDGKAARATKAAAPAPKRSAKVRGKKK